MKNSRKNKQILIAAITILTLCLTLLTGCGSSGKKDIISVTNPQFELKDDFILDVDVQRKAPDGFIGISNADDFNKIRNNPSAAYILLDDIDLSGIDWEPIKEFSGDLNGNGHVVSGVSATLFYKVKGGVIRNLGVEGNLSGHSAAIVLYLSKGAVDNCFFHGSLYNDGYAAGLVLENSNSFISNCYNTADITGNGATAGISCLTAGDSFTIQNCFNTGTIYNTGDFNGNRIACSAGILGRSERTSGMIRHCYNLGTISCYDPEPSNRNTNYGDAISCGILGYANVPDSEWLSIDYCYNGGLIEGGDLAFGIGETWGTSANRTQVSNCYNYGEFTYPNSYGIAGCVTGTNAVGNMAIRYCYNASTTGAAAISNNSTDLYECYYLDTIPYATANDALFSNVYELSAKQMKKEKNFSLDFDNIWAMGKGDYSYPVFAYKNFEFTDAMA